MALKITISEEKEVVKVELNGRIDSFAIDELNSGFDAVMKKGKKNILLIMKDLEYINSRGCGALISFLKWVKKVGGLVKIAEVPIHVMQVFNILGLDGLTLIYESSTDALESFKRQQAGEGREEEDDNAPPRPMPERPYEGRKQRNSLLLWAVILLILLGTILLLSRGGPEGKRGVELEPLEDKIEQLSQRLSRLEARMGRPGPSSGDENGSLKNLAGQIGRLAEDYKQLKKEVVRMGEKKDQDIQGEGPAPEKSTAPGIHYHLVQPGESLYRIGRRYGISIEELCTLNKIRRKNTIYPGQKLIVGQSGRASGDRP